MSSPTNHSDKRHGTKIEDDNKLLNQQEHSGVNNSEDSAGQHFKFSDNLSLERIRQLNAEFSTARNWDQYHQPRNLLLAMVGEVGEVSELFQWRPDSECQPGLPGWTDEQRVALGEELSDVLVYLVSLADRCQIDLPTALLQKMAKNGRKYPIEKAFGSAKKYNEL